MRWWRGSRRAQAMLSRDDDAFSRRMTGAGLGSAPHFTAECAAHREELLELEAAASSPYTSFTYGDAAQAHAVAALLLDRGVAEWCPPACELLVSGRECVGFYAALDDAMLRRRRLGAALVLSKSDRLRTDTALADRLRLAGTTLMRAQPGDWYLSRVAVAPRARGAGHGRRLVDRYLEVGRAKGLRRAILEVAPGSDGAVRLYEAVGFRTLDERSCVDPGTRRELRYRHMVLDL